MKFIFSFLILLISRPAFSQVAGCTDPMAINYNRSAKINNGSCTYKPIAYTPPIKVDPISIELDESSGLQMADNFLWTFNDGGGIAAIYRIDTLKNALLQTVFLQGATNNDWEDIAFDGTYFYVGDFGNNANGARTNLRIYKFPITAIPDYVDDPITILPAEEIEIINFTYSNQAQPPVPAAAFHTKFDCEAMIVDDGKIHLFTKNWIDANTTHYIIDSLDEETYIAKPLETLATGYLVTGADIAPGSATIALVGYQVTGLAKHFMHILSGYSGGKYFNGNKRKIDLPDATVMGQVEGIAFRTDTYGYISNERLSRNVGNLTFTVKQKLRSFDIRNFTKKYISPENKKISVKKQQKKT